VLQRASTADPEVPAARSGAVRPGGEPVDHSALPPAMAAGAEPSPDAVARHREGHEYLLASVLGDAVPSRADPLDGELDGTLG
jgi:hypothetical protein